MQLEQQRFRDTLAIRNFKWCTWEAAVVVRDKIADAEGVKDIWTQLDHSRAEAAAVRLGIKWKVLKEFLRTRSNERQALAHPNLDLMAEQWRKTRPAFVRQRPNVVEKYETLLQVAGVAISDASNTNA
ncbi:hypothetical protein ACK3TF_006262 [Chlorella vulgaris]